MGYIFYLEGATGRPYQYGVTDPNNLNAVPLQAANYAFARSTTGDPVVVYVATAKSLRKAFGPETLGCSDELII